MLEWFVYYENVNQRMITTHNIFNHWGFREDLQKALKKVHVMEDRPEERKEFLETVKRSLMYWYWSKCEWEIILTSWPPDKKNFKDEKIDVYDQILINWYVFSDYIWSHRRELKRELNKK